MTGGTAANLSALVVARDVWRKRAGEHGRSALAVSDAADSSVVAAARAHGRANGRRADRREGPSHGRSARPCARRDRGRGRRVRCRRYGRHYERRVRRRPRGDRRRRRAATLVAPRRRRVRPGCARSEERTALVRRSRARRLVLGRSAQMALRPVRLRRVVYRDPEPARIADTQHAAYLDVLHTTPDWNPSDYAFHLDAVAGAGLALLVLARDARHRCIRHCDRRDARADV